MTRKVRPLAARTYLLRNPRRVWPAVVVQALVTALVLAVVTPLTGFEETVEANMRPLTVYTGLTPMRRNTFDEGLVKIVEANPAMERHVAAKMIWMRTPMIVGEMYSMVLALDAAEVEAFVSRVGNRLAEGSLPKPRSSGVAIHRDIAMARRMGIGDKFGRLVDPEDPAPGVFEVVGILDGPARIGVADLTYASIPDFVLARIEQFEVVYAKPGRKAESDAYLEAAKDADGLPAFKVWSEAFWRKRQAKMLENLPAVVNAIVGSITVVIGLVVALLALIGFQSRSDEFALLLAVGHSRARLVWKLALESAAQAVLAWVLGLGLGFAFLSIYDRAVLAPKAILIRYGDPYPIALASALPLLASAVSALALAFRVRRMDPVGVIQRRNA